MAIHWSKLQDLLFDSDGSHPSQDRFAGAMREFRDHGYISDYWFCDTSETEQIDESGRFYDTWNEAWLCAEECGPKQNEVDFTGL